jgi:hypothetical protein
LGCILNGTFYITFAIEAVSLNNVMITYYISSSFLISLLLQWHSKTWLIQNSRDQKESSFLIMKNLCNSKFKKKLTVYCKKNSLAPIGVICGCLSQITISRGDVILNTCFDSVVCYIGKFYFQDLVFLKIVILNYLVRTV